MLPLAWHRVPHLQEDSGQDHHGHACAKVLMRDTNHGRGHTYMAEAGFSTAIASGMPAICQALT